MSLQNTIETKCLHCGNKSEVEVFLSINTDTDPELKDKVINGSAFLWTCPNCGRVNLLKYETLYHDPENSLMFWLIPDEKLQIKPIEEYMSSMKSLESSLEGYTTRRVSSVGELIEKIKIFDAGLDDAVMEMAKFVIRQDEKLPLDATIHFAGFDGADSTITFTFPKDGRMMAIDVGFSTYEDCAGIISRNKDLLPDGIFPKIDRDFIESKIG